MTRERENGHSEETVNENPARTDAPIMEKETNDGGSIEMQIDTMEKESGWQEVREQAKRAEKGAPQRAGRKHSHR